MIQGFWLGQLSGWLMLPLLPWPDGMKSILECQNRVSLGSVEFEDHGSGDDLLKVRIPQNALA